MNYVDKNIKELAHCSTMGILICKRENKFVIEYCSDERIAVREYRLVQKPTKSKPSCYPNSLVLI